MFKNHDLLISIISDITDIKSSICGAVDDCTKCKYYEYWIDDYHICAFTKLIDKITEMEKK